MVSKFTSYVAVDPKQKKELKESGMMMKSLDVPVQVAHGWGGLSMDSIFDCGGYTSEEGKFLP